MQPDPLEDEADHAQVAGDRVLDAHLAAGHAGKRHEAPHLDVVGADVVLAAVQLPHAGDGEDVGADSLDVGAHLHEHPGEVLHMGLAGGVADHGRPRNEGGCHEDVLRAHHGGLVHEDVCGREALRRVQNDVAVELDAGAEGAEPVHVRVQAAPSDHVATGRGHHGAAEAGEERAGEQEGRAHALGELLVHLHLVDARAADGDLVVAPPRDVRPEGLQDREHDLHVGDPGHVAHDDLVGCEDGGCEDGQRAVLVAGWYDGAGQRDAAVDDELLH